MKKSFSTIQHYAEKKSWKFHIILTIICLVIYSSIIIFGFVPVTKIIELSGYSTSDLQNAMVRSVADTVLLAFESVINYVILLSILDYVFIVAGFVLFISFNAMIFKALIKYQKFLWVPLLGVILTIVSRSLDSLENLWTILIYSNPENYATFLLPTVHYTGLLKWGVVGVEYTTVLVGLIIVIVLKLKQKKEK